MSKKRKTGFFGAFWRVVARAEEKNHRGTEGTEVEVARLSVPSVPLWFKRLDKNMVLFGALKRFDSKFKDERINPSSPWGESHVSPRS